MDFSVTDLEFIGMPVIATPNGLLLLPPIKSSPDETSQQQEESLPDEPM